jgi:SAM-dependent methyltransferase
MLGILVLPLATPGTLAAQPGGSDPPPFVPTAADLVELILSLGEVDADDIVYDLGSGDGRLVIAAAERGARAIGVEFDPHLVELSRATAANAGVAEHARFVEGDIFATDIHDATVVILYLSAEFNLRLRPRLLEQLRPGARIVSHAFHMREWAPDSVSTVGSGARRATVYQWTVPARVDGFWSLEIPSLAPVAVEFLQRFQALEGTARSGSESLLGEGRVLGDLVDVRFVDDAGDDTMRFTGRLAGGRIVGTVSGPAPFGVREAVAVRLSDPSRAPR